MARNQALMQPPVIILLRPQMGENIGASARAMKNCGISELRLVAPRDGWPNPDAVPMASSATDILDNAELYDDIGAALHDVTLAFATTARRRDMVKPELNPRQAAEMTAKQPQEAGQRIAFLFGAERSGMDNEEAVLADYIVSADLNPEFSSLNLAQAVLMISWEWRMAALGTEAAESDALWPELATLQDRDFFFSRFEAMLDEKEFFATAEMAPVVKRNLRAFFTRATPTKQELRTWHGILTKLEKS
ncbi:MAG: RNA methyltransferase [Candidatus Puniceispirillaceae bacterium]